MKRSSSSGTPRRRFLGELAAGAAALAGTACAAPMAASTAAAPAPQPANGGTPTPTPVRPATPPVPTKWDDSWMQKLTGKHKAVFDSPEIGEGAAIYHAFSYLRSLKDMYNTTDAEANAVVVLRHSAVPLLFNDAMWVKYGVGKEAKVKDYKTKKFVTRNIFYQNVDAQGNPATEERPTPTIKSLTARGVIFLGCDLATRGFAYQFAQAAKQDHKVVYEELKQNLVPGATLMPTGVFATLLAQEAGCSFMRST